SNFSGSQLPLIIYVRRWFWLEQQQAEAALGTPPPLLLLLEDTSQNCILTSVLFQNSKKGCHIECVYHISTLSLGLTKRSRPMTKRIRSLPPDIVVEVGTGEAMRQFDCYKAALCFASPVFDLMFSNDMAENNDDRVRLPEKDPGEFMLFYSFIEHTGRVNSDNALTLAPWFHEFQMKRYLEECDEMLVGSIADYTRRDFSSTEKTRTGRNISRRSLASFNLRCVTGQTDFVEDYELANMTAEELAENKDAPAARALPHEQDGRENEEPRRGQIYSSHN
ncbi:hypothetical protein THAOC_26738, partial [Thalassiosira oceanica]